MELNLYYLDNTVQLGMNLRYQLFQVDNNYHYHKGK